MNYICLLKKYWLCSSEVCIFVLSGILYWSELLFGYWVFVLLTITAFNVSHSLCVSLLRYRGEILFEYSTLI